MGEQIAKVNVALTTGSDIAESPEDNQLTFIIQFSNALIGLTPASAAAVKAFVSKLSGNSVSFVTGVSYRILLCQNPAANVDRNLYERSNRHARRSNCF